MYICMGPGLRSPLGKAAANKQLNKEVYFERSHKVGLNICVAYKMVYDLV